MENVGSFLLWNPDDEIKALQDFSGDQESTKEEKPMNDKPKTERNPSLCMTVDVAPGSNIQNVCKQACALSKQTGVTIWFVFNEVKCCARPDDDASLLMEAYHLACDDKREFGIAVAKRKTLKKNQ